MGLWSRPGAAPGWATGSLPNSPPQTTSVSSSIPRCLRSASKVPMGWSVSFAKPPWVAWHPRAVCRPAGGCARPLPTVRGSRQSHAKKADPVEHRPYAFLHFTQFFLKNVCRGASSSAPAIDADSAMMHTAARLCLLLRIISCLRSPLLSILRFIATSGQVFQTNILVMHNRPVAMILKRQQPLAGSVLRVQVH